MGVVAWLATVFSILYLTWAIRNNPICFIFGIISSCFWAYESYVHLHLKFDAGLQIFYVLMSILGIYSWKYGGGTQREKQVSTMPTAQHGIAISIGIMVSVILISLSRYFDSILFPILDAFTTVFLIIGTLLLVERKLESWIYLVICDLVYIYIYGVQGAWLFVGMMVVYSIFGMVGYRNWKAIKSDLSST